MQTLDICGQVAQSARIHGTRQFFRRGPPAARLRGGGRRDPDLPVARGAEEAVPRGDVVAAMKRAAGTFHDKVAVHGGYVYFVSLDGQQRLGKGRRRRSRSGSSRQPRRPSAWRTCGRTGSPMRNCSSMPRRDAGTAAIYGQLKSGGWRNAIDFDPQGALAANYRNGKGKAKGANTSTLDDGSTQAAAPLCLMTLDQTLDFKDPTVHESARFALDSLLAAHTPTALPAGLDGARRPAPDRPGQVSGLRLADREPGQGILEPLHAQRPARRGCDGNPRRRPRDLPR